LNPINPPADVDLISRTFKGRMPPAGIATAQVAPPTPPLPLNLQGTTTAVIGDDVELCNAMQPADDPPVGMEKASV
jgi:hypothetical protein